MAKSACHLRVTRRHGGLFRVGAGSSVVSRQASKSRRQCRVIDRVIRRPGQNPPMTIRAFTSGELEQACRVVAEAMTGGQLGGLLSDAGIPDGSGESTKRRRLRGCVGSRQRRAPLLPTSTKAGGSKDAADMRRRGLRRPFLMSWIGPRRRPGGPAEQATRLVIGPSR
jgi:hypothetical protein